MPGCLCWPCDQSLYWPHVWHLEALLDAHGKAPLWWPAKINEELGYFDTVFPCPLWKVDPLKVKVVILVSEHQVPCMVQRLELEYGVKLSSAGKLAEAEKTSKTSEQSASPKREPEKKNKRKVKPGASAAWRKSWAECDKTYHWEIKMNSLRIAAELHTFSNSAWPTCPARVKTLTSLWMSPCNSLRGAGCGKNQQCKPMREGKYALALLPWSFGVYQSILPSKSKNHHKASTLWQQQFCFCALPPEQTRSRLSERKDWLHLTTVVAFEHVKNS